VKSIFVGFIGRPLERVFAEEHEVKHDATRPNVCRFKGVSPLFKDFWGCKKSVDSETSYYAPVSRV
jgi:hypothetical protein